MQEGPLVQLHAERVLVQPPRACPPPPAAAEAAAPPAPRLAYNGAGAGGGAPSGRTWRLPRSEWMCDVCSTRRTLRAPATSAHARRRAGRRCERAAGCRGRRAGRWGGEETGRLARPRSSGAAPRRCLRPRRQPPWSSSARAAAHSARRRARGRGAALHLLDRSTARRSSIIYHLSETGDSASMKEKGRRAARTCRRWVLGRPRRSIKSRPTQR